MSQCAKEQGASNVPFERSIGHNMANLHKRNQFLFERVMKSFKACPSVMFNVFVLLKDNFLLFLACSAAYILEYVVQMSHTW